MRIASFNVENLFDRAKIFNKSNSVSNKINSAVAELGNLFELTTYSVADKSRMVELLTELNLTKSDSGTFVILRAIRGKFLKRPKNAPIEIIANGRKDWVGWLELKTEPVNEVAIMNTGRVLKDANADIIAVVEAEDRVALKLFSDDVIKQVQGTPYSNVMLIDGNDDRGIDVAIMTKSGFNIGMMRSHINDLQPNGQPIFSRDCPEYSVTTPNGTEIWVLPNHFKSKFGGDDIPSQNKRLAQATKVKEIYQRLIAEGKQNVVILGDFNDTPLSNPLAPLLRDTDLKDVAKHPSFNPGEYSGIGTFGSGTNSNKIDYILLSPALFSKITACGLFRKGAYPGKNPKWTVYPELVEEVHAASDHHLIWVDLNIP